MSRFDQARGLVPGHRLLAILLATMSLSVAAGELSGQDADQMNELLTIWAHHPLTGERLPAETPHPIRGIIGDGTADRIPYQIEVRYENPDDGTPTAAEIGNDLFWGNLDATIVFYGSDREEEDIWWEGDPLFQESWQFSPFRDGSEMDNPHSRAVWGTLGEVDLPFDILPETILYMQAILKRNDTPIDTFTTEIRPGMPELRFTSTIISRNMQNALEGLEITGTVTGRTGLEFTDGYLTLTGRGEVIYENFHVSMSSQTAPIGSCDFLTSTTNGYFTVPEIVLFRDSLPAPVPAPDPGTALAVSEAVFFIERGIDESLTIDCSMSPVKFPLPRVLHFYAGFYSIHGGQVAPFPNEVDEDRGGLVIGGWEAGEGDVIATRTYDRQGDVGPGTLVEQTTLELRWRR